MEKQHFDKAILVTGGAGFIGSHLVRRLVKVYPDTLVVNMDSLTYAGNLENLTDIEDYPNYRFEKADICDATSVMSILRRYHIDGVIHLAAESHVDRSISDPLDFVRTNVIGTVNMLQCAKNYWESLPEKYTGKLFHHVSTDEVYGALELGNGQMFEETTRYDPHSPYSAAKASSDHFVRAWHDTYGMPTLVTNCSNNYGPNQFPEKLIPLFINNIRNRRPLPVYGKGENIRDWLYVEDHAEALDLVFHNGKAGDTYNIGGCIEWRNIDLIKALVKITDQELGRPEGDSVHLINFVTDRKGHDLRYAIDASKIEHELGWRPRTCFEDGLRATVRWYLDNIGWLENVTSGAYADYYKRMYSGR